MATLHHPRATAGLLACALASCVMIPVPATPELDAPAPPELVSLAAEERVGLVQVGAGPVADAMEACVEDRLRRALAPGAVMTPQHVREAVGPAVAPDGRIANGDPVTALRELTADAAVAERLRARQVRYLIAIAAGRSEGTFQHAMGGEFAGYLARTDRVTAVAAYCDVAAGTCGPAARAHADEPVGMSHILPAFFFFSVVVVGVGGETAACDALAAALLEGLGPPRT